MSNPFGNPTKAEKNALNRIRRNRPKILSRRWNGKLRRSDERAERKSYAIHLMEMVKYCHCEDPNHIPCESVLCGSFCERRTHHNSHDEEDDY